MQKEIKKTVALIDDDPDDLDLMAEIILSIDPAIECLSFVRPEEALKVLLEGNPLQAPDYIFIDMNMPRITGDKCLRTLRSHEDFKQSIIILYSTSMPATIADALIANGANHVFQKPVKIKEYTDIIGGIIHA